MIRNLGWPALLAPLGFAILLAPIASSGSKNEQEGEAVLVRPAGAPDPDAKGEVEIEHHLNEYEESFEVEAEHLDLSQTYDVYLEDAVGSGNLVSIGTMAVEIDDDDEDEDDDEDDDDEDDDEDEDEDDELTLSFETEDGASLPFGVTFVSDLSGRVIEIRSGGSTYLAGVVPALGASGPKSKVKTELMRPANAPDADAAGEIYLKKEGVEQEFEVEAEHVDVANTVFAVWIEDAVGSGVFQNVGAMVADKSGSSGSSGEASLELETGDGEALPLGVHDLSELAGRALQVRGDDGFVYLAGLVPAFGIAPVKVKSSLAGAGKGLVRVRTKPKKGAQEFRVELAKQPKKASLEIWIENPENDSMELAATLSTKKSGKAKWKVRNKKGGTLPLGVLSVEALAGRPIEVRDGDGTVLLTGTVPGID